MRISDIRTANEYIDKTYKKIDNKRKMIGLGAEAGIIGAGVLASKYAAKDKSSIQNGASTVVDFIAKKLKKGLNFVDKKQSFTKNITGALDKTLKASAKTKAFGLIGAVAGFALLKVIQANNQIKGAIFTSKEFSKEAVNKLPGIITQAKNAGRTEEKINTTMKELDRQFNKEIFEPMRERYLSQE